MVGHLVAVFFQSSIIYLKLYPFGFYIFFFCVGIPLVLLNHVETKYVWQKMLGKNIDILGVSVGLAIGIITYYRFA